MDLVGAIDQGTSSTRFLVFDIKTGTVVSSHQMEIQQQFPEPGWVEIDANEIIRTVMKCMNVAVKQLDDLKIDKSQFRAVGIANQRETTVVWDKETGKPLFNAIVWLDSRTSKLSEYFSERNPGKSKDYFRSKTGLPINPYFSALKIHWLLQNVDSVKEAHRKGVLKGVPVSGILGDQQAALVGHCCLRPGDLKNTYGTGTFMLCNVGTKPVFSENGLISTVAFQLGQTAEVYYALEGSGSIGGNVIRFLRDNLSFFKEAGECEELAKSIESTEGVVFVPCFTGLYSPYWDSTARGAIFGLTQFTGKAHITRAALEAVCYQSADIVDAVTQDLPDDCTVRVFKADGGMTRNAFFNQMQSDIMGMDLVTSKLAETTALGAAIAASVGVGLKKIEDFANDSTGNSVVYSPRADEKTRRKGLQIWRDAVRRSRNWVIERCDELTNGF